MEIDITNWQLGHLRYCLIIAREVLLNDIEKYGNNDRTYSKYDDVMELLDAVDKTIQNINLK